MKIAIPWWKSKVIVGGALSVLATVLKTTGVLGDIPDETISQIADVVVTVVAGGGAAVAVGARVSQKEAPLIVASNAGAELIKDAHQQLQQAAPVVEAVTDATDVEVPSWMLR